jgi:outer membrane receptor for ferrienterochelin and colicins
MNTIRITASLMLMTLFFALTGQFYASNENNSSNRELSGKIFDSETKEPLVGVNILIKNTNIGTATDINGIFSITKIPKEEFELQISLVGYKALTVKILDEMINGSLLEFELRQAMIEMGTVVVTGTNTPHLYENVPVKTEIVTRKLINQQGACNLSQALGLQTGLLVENDCNNCNFTQVRILGFDGKYSQILIDGDPVISSLGGVYGLEHYPQEMIEQIEIVKGGGSALYGGGAIAGTINMMTRRPAFNTSRVGYYGASTNGSYEQQIGAIAEIVNEDNTAGFYIFGSTRNRNAYDHNNDGFTELGQLKNETIGFNSYFRPWYDSELRVSFHRIFEERRGGSELEKPIHESEISEWTKHLKYGGKIKWEQKLNSALSFKINYALSLLERDSYYGGLAEDTPEGRLDALNYYGFSENPLHTGGVQINQIFESHSITAGVQHDYDKLVDKSVASEAYYLDEKFRNTGLFIQDEFSIGNANPLDVVAGLRFDNHSALENWVVSPRLNLRYKPFAGDDGFSNSLIMRAGFTTGFKAPQIFDEDLHICGLEGTQRVIRNSVNLKEERSSTFSVGMEFQDFVKNVPLLIGVTAFYTNLFNAYTDEFISSEGNIEYWERINSGGAIVKGIEFDFGIKPVSALEIRSGITFKENRYAENLPDFNTNNFLRTPGTFGYIRTSYEFNPGLSVFASMKYMGRMDVPHEIIVENQDDPLLMLSRSPEFLEFDFTISQRILIFNGLNSVLTIGAKNITNAYQKDLDFGAQRDPAYVYGPSQPRTFYLSLNVNI